MKNRKSKIRLKLWFQLNKCVFTYRKVDSEYFWKNHTFCKTMIIPGQWSFKEDQEFCLPGHTSKVVHRRYESNCIVLRSQKVFWHKKYSFCAVFHELFKKSIEIEKSDVDFRFLGVFRALGRQFSSFSWTKKKQKCKWL